MGSNESANVSSIRAFISYRRNDSPHAAGRIADHLMSRFGNQSVFRDVDAIEVGVDYKHRLLNAIPSCNVVLTVIGPTWASLRDRLCDEKDVLRQELECALALRIPVVPILIDRTTMPTEEDLPASLKGLARLEAQRINDSTFRIDLDRLLAVLEKCHGGNPVDIPTPSPGSPITGEHLALINSSWRAPQHDSRFSEAEVYRFDVILAGDPSVLARVEKVVYMLPPAWPTSPIEVDSRTPLFGLKELAWSDLLVRARIYIRQQFEPIYLSSFVRLTEHGTRLVPR